MHAADLPQVDYLREVASKLATAGHGGKSRIVDEATAFLGVSKQTFYRRLERLGHDSGRKTRCDVGESVIAPDAARFVAGLLTESSRANGKRLLTLDSAIDIAVENGYLETRVSGSAMSRVLTQHGLHPDQLKRPAPHVLLQSRHPNHCWQIDASVCVLYRLGDKGMQVIDEKEFYKNRPERWAKIEDQRILRYVATDHTTGAFYVEYILASGESASVFFNFFVNAIQKRDHAQDPMHGVPLIVLSDKGSATENALIQNFFKRMHVKPLTHQAGNPRAKGQVEVTNNIIERGFEGRLSFLKIESIEQLNNTAQMWARWYNGTQKHSRHGHTRYSLWQTIREEHLRIAPPVEVCRDLLSTHPTPAKVRGDLTVSYTVKGWKSQRYSVAHIPQARVGELIDICVNPYRAPAIDIFIKALDGTERLYVAEPVEIGYAGFNTAGPVIGESYHSARDDDLVKHRKEIAKEAYNAETLQEAEKQRKGRAPAYGGTLDVIDYLEAATPANYMRRRGQELEVEIQQIEVKPLTHTRAALMLVERGLEMTPAMHETMRAMFPDGVPEDQFEALYARLSTQPSTVQAGPWGALKRAG